MGIVKDGSVKNLFGALGIWEAALADRPPAGIPGRLFVDTDTPSTGMYRDTGIVWEQVATVSAGGVTSVGLSAPTGFEVTDSPVTGSGTIALVFEPGYSLPTNAAQQVWNKVDSGDTLNNNIGGNAFSSIYATLSQQWGIEGGLLYADFSAVDDTEPDYLIGAYSGTSKGVSAGAALEFLGITGGPFAPVDSPALTGDPTAPTQTSTDNSTKLATTAFVKGTAIQNQSAADQSASFRISGSGRIGTTLRVVGVFQCDDNATIQGFISVGTNQDAVWAATFNNLHATGKGVTISGGGGSDYSLLVNDYSGSFRFGVQADGHVASAGTVTSGSGFVVTGSSAERVMLGDGQLGYIKRFNPFGDGVSTVISFAHGMTGISSASSLVVMANNANAGGILWSEVDGSGNINVYYATPPPADELLLTVIATPV